MARAKLKVQEPLETPAERIAALEGGNRVYFWKPYDWQKRIFKNLVIKNTTAVISANKIGKTASAACIVISWALGYEPWNRLSEDDGNCVRVRAKGRDFFFRKSSLGIDPPVSIIITGEDWKLHLGKVIVGELKRWAPVGFYETRKNEQGVDYYWEWMNKSTFTLMCYTQDDALFESFRAQGAWEDEPPPKAKHTALSRGLLLDNGKTLMSLTPIKEAWVLDDIVLSGRKDIGIVDNLMITDNPDLLRSDLDVLGSMGLSYGGELRDLQDYCRSRVSMDGKVERFFDLLFYDDKEKGKPVTDKGHRAEIYLEEVVPEEKHSQIGLLKMLKFIKDIDPSDVPPRVFGMFKSLVGRVLKDFDESIHRIKPFAVPTDWPVIVMIDFHLSTPQAVSYWTVNRQDIHYLIAETWDNLSAAEIADDIIRKVRAYGWRIEDAYIDPLSKGDTAYMKNELGTNIEDTFTKLQRRLEKERIRLHVASKDKESGIMNIRTWLKGPNGMPTVYLFEDCPRHFYEIARWVYDEDGKPIKENDHFMENWYRYTLAGNKYTTLRKPGEDFKAEINFDVFADDYGATQQKYEVW